MNRIVLFFSLSICILFTTQQRALAQLWIPTALPDSLSVISLAVTGNYVFAGCSFPLDSSIYRSTDYGFSWHVASQGLPLKASIKTFAINDSFIYAGGTGIYRSSDYGDNWTAIGLMNNQVEALAINRDSSGVSHLFAGTSTGLFVSTDSGITWQSSGFARTSVNSLAIIGTNVIAGTVKLLYPAPNKGSVCLSTDFGTSWTAINHGLTDSIVNCFGIVDSNIYAGSMNAGVFLSTNNGAQWQGVNNGLTNSIIRTLGSIGPNVFAGTNSGVFLSIDNGGSWVDTKFPSGQIVWNIAISKDFIFATSDPAGGVWWCQLSRLLSVQDPTNGLPSQLKLYQNYPNPLNPSTTISFSLPRSSFVTIKIYNVLGQIVSTLLQERRVPGTYNVQFDASNLPSGVYYYRLSAGDFIQTKKMLVVK